MDWKRIFRRKSRKDKNAERIALKKELMELHKEKQKIKEKERKTFEKLKDLQ